MNTKTVLSQVAVLSLFLFTVLSGCQSICTTCNTTQLAGDWYTNEGHLVMTISEDGQVCIYGESEVEALIMNYGDGLYAIEISAEQDENGINCSQIILAPDGDDLKVQAFSDEGTCHDGAMLTRNP